MARCKGVGTPTCGALCWEYRADPGGRGVCMEGEVDWDYFHRRILPGVYIARPSRRQVAL